MTKIVFVYDFNKSNRLEKPIYLVIYFSRTIRKTISSKIYVRPDQWDHNGEKIINHQGAIILNVELSKIKAKYQEIELTALRQGELYSIEYLNRVLNIERGPQNNPLTFNKFMYQSIITQTQLEIGTIKDHQKTYKHFTALFPTLKFEKFSIKQVLVFDNWMINQNFATSTRGNHHKNLKKYLNLAAINGVYEYATKDYPYTHFKVERGGGTRSFLDVKEIKILETIVLPEHLEAYRKMFLFLCYTGLRISDFMRIHKGLLVEDILVLRPLKTTKHATEVRLPLKDLFAGKPYEIWQSFDFEFPIKKGFDNKMNISIKLIADIAKIKKLLTCHVARHTFLTFIAIRTGNVLKVMKLGGLRKMDTAMIYIHLAEQDSRDFVKSVNWEY